MQPLIVVAVLIACLSTAVAAAPCRFQAQGEGLVQAALDARTLRLEDGREVRLAGITVPLTEMDTTADLTALIVQQSVTLEGPDDAPDRYGRQPAFVLARDAADSVQIALLKRGRALHDGTVSEGGCLRALRDPEAEPRRPRMGLWAESAAIKNAEKPDDILAVTGQFAVIEGKALSVRQAGTTFYVNFGRRWTDGFAVTISRRMIAVMEGAGLSPKTLEGRRLRVRGVVERRIGPRIDIARVGQIELAD